MRAEQKTERKTKDAAARELAIVAWLGKAGEPASRREIRMALGGTDAKVRAAVGGLLATSGTGIVECGPKVGGS